MSEAGFEVIGEMPIPIQKKVVQNELLFFVLKVWQTKRPLATQPDVSFATFKEILIISLDFLFLLNSSFAEYYV